MHVVLSWKTEYRQVAWSVGECRHCDQPGAVRVEDAIQVFSIYFLPVNRAVVGSAYRCDFCERAAESLATEDVVDLSAWEPSEGLDALLGRLDLEPPEVAAPPDARLNSLLSATRAASALDAVDASLGLTTGIFAGLALGVVAGLWLSEGVAVEPDRFGFVFLRALIGLPVGAVVGAMLAALVNRGRVARAKIRAAHARYGLDLRRLEDLAHSYPGTVLRAVIAVRDEG